MTRKCTRCMVPMELDPDVYALLNVSHGGVQPIKIYRCTKCGKTEIVFYQNLRYRDIKAVETALDLEQFNKNVEYQEALPR